MSLRTWLRGLLGDGITSELHARRWARMLPQNLDPATRHPDLPWLPLIDRVLEPGDTALDLGAHGGGFAYPMSLRVGPTGSVHAFEILPYYRMTLAKTMKRLGVENVEIHPYGVGRCDEEIELVVADEQGRPLTGNIHIRGPEERPARTEHVRIRSLDALIAERPELAEARFVKIDVEGAELDAVVGGSRFLGERQPTVLAEVTTRQTARYGHDIDVVLDELARLGYIAARITSDGYAMRSALGDVTPNGDWLLVPVERGEAEIARLTQPT